MFGYSLTSVSLLEMTASHGIGYLKAGRMSTGPSLESAHMNKFYSSPTSQLSYVAVIHTCPVHRPFQGRPSHDLPIM